MFRNSRTPLSRRALALAALLGLPVSTAGHAASFRLSDGQSFSDVADVGGSIGPDNYLPVVSPDGRTAIYIHDADTDEAFELWRVGVAGGSPVRVSGLLPSGQRAFGFRFTPNGQRILYRARQDDADAIELYSVPVAAPTGSWVRLNEPLAPGSGIDLVGVSPDSSSVAYEVWSDPGARNHQIWVAASDGGSRTQVVSMPADREFTWAAVAPSFSRLVFVSDRDVDERFELWSVPTTGGIPVKLNGVLTGEGDVQSFDIAPGSGRVAYVADQQTNEVFEAYSAPIGGGAPIKISAPLPAGSDVLGVAYLPGGQRVLYFVVAAATGQIEIWSASPLGGDADRLHPVLAADRSITSFAISPDGSRVVFVADLAQNDVFELWSVPASGGEPVRLNGTLTSGGDVAIEPRPAFTPDGGRVIYVADQLQDGRLELFGVPAAGGTALRLNRTLVSPGQWQVLGFVPTADSTRVAYVLRSRPSAVDPWQEGLYSVAVTAGASTRLDGPASTGGDVHPTPVVPPSGSRFALYLADQGFDEQYDLYSGDLCLFCDGFEAGSTARWLLP
jgi:Tol biopolymer transport system component